MTCQTTRGRTRSNSSPFYSSGKVCCIWALPQIAGLHQFGHRGNWRPQVHVHLRARVLAQEILEPGDAGTDDMRGLLTDRTQRRVEASCCLQPQVLPGT